MTDLSPAAAALRVGVIGIHGFSRETLSHLRRLGTNLIGVVAHDADRDPAWRAELTEAGLRLLPDLDALLALKPQVVFVPVGIHLHRRFAEACFAAGAHVYLEKPIAGCLADADAIDAAATRAGRLLLIGFQDLFQPGVWALKRRLADAGGVIGRVQRIVVEVPWPRGHAYYARNPWAGRMEIDGIAVRDSPLNNAAAHFLMLALFLAGRRVEAAATPLRASGVLLRTYAIASFDTGSVRVSTAEGVDVVMTAAHALAEHGQERLRIDGERGCIGFDLRDVPYEIALPDGDRIAMDWRFGPNFSAALAVFAGEDRPASRYGIARAHAAAIEVIHRDLRITDVAPARIATASAGMHLIGLRDAMATAFARGATLDEVGFT